MKEELTVLLLAGGKSSRFWPLTSKMTYIFMGKTFLERQVSLLKEVGFKNIIVVASSEIAQRFASSTAEIIVQQGEGQGAAILSTAAKIAGKPLLVVNADDLVAKDLFLNLLTKIAGTHNLLVGYKTESYFPGGYLVLDGKKVARVHEKPGEGNTPSSFVKLVCDYFVSADTLVRYLEKTDRSDPNRHYENALSEMMKQGEIFEMVEYSDSWLPLKYPWQTLDLMDDYLDQIKVMQISKSAKVHKTASLIGPIVLGEHVRVMEYSKLVGPLYIGAGTIVGNHSMVRRSMIGENAVIGFGCDVTRSFIGSDTWFHSNYIGDSVIGNHVAMGAGSILANLRLDEGDVYSNVKGERISSGRNKLGAILGEGVRIGVGVRVMPGVKVGQNSVVGPGVILQEDLADNKRCLVKQTHAFSENVISNVRDRSRFRNKL